MSQTHNPEGYKQMMDRLAVEKKKLEQMEAAAEERKAVALEEQFAKADAFTTQTGCPFELKVCCVPSLVSVLPVSHARSPTHAHPCSRPIWIRIPRTLLHRILYGTVDIRRARLWAYLRSKMR
jgi:hypothetical protein